jgi:asparagine synthase (glutamine-hydrolysing)
MLAGTVCRRGLSPVAVTFGKEGDLELECARPVAAALGLEHHVAPVRDDRMLWAAELTANWEHLAGGFSALTGWTLVPELRRYPAPVAAAYFLDGTLGGSLLSWAFDPEANTLSFPSLFARVKSYGLAPATLTRLLRPDVGGALVQDTAEDLRRRYNRYPGRESQRVYAFTLHHRIRFHAGGDPWRLCFAAWPVLPGADREVLAAALRIPAPALAERRAQIEYCCARFPDLAALPLDRNSYDTRPLLPRPRALVAHAIRSRMARVGLRRRTAERRYYYRTYDLNGPGWRAIRAAAERCRSRVADVFDPRVLDEVLPPPETPVCFEDPIVQSSGLKLLVGFLLWSKDHL